jgi:O-acetyl-ADP-ribose deacetylase (regulator of RNase III)/transcriptional regulator with XRE-family HTH domain
MMRDQRGEPDLPPGPARDLVDLYRRLRHARQLTGGQIAVKTGLSPGHISDVMRGWRVPSPDTAMKLASALGGNLDEAARAGRLAEELAELKRYSRRKAHEGPRRFGHPGLGMADQDPFTESVMVASAGRRAAVLGPSEIRRYRVIGLPEHQEHYIGTVTGDIRRVRCADVWVNPENTEMVMARFNEFSVSSIVRYEGALLDDGGQVVDDRIADELTRKVAGRTPVLPGTAILTGAGELARYQVKFVIHVAAVQGEPGAGYRQIVEIGRCVTNAMSEVDKIDARPALTTILFPLLGAGHGGGDLKATISALVGSAIDYFTSTPFSHLTTAYFLAYTDAEVAACERLLTANKRLIAPS